MRIELAIASLRLWAQVNSKVPEIFTNGDSVKFGCQKEAEEKQTELILRQAQDDRIS